MRAASASPGNTNVHAAGKRAGDDIDLDIFRGTTRVVLDGGHPKTRDQRSKEVDSEFDHGSHPLPMGPSSSGPAMQPNQYIYPPVGSDWPPALPRLHNLTAQGQSSANNFGMDQPIGGGVAHATHFVNAFDTYDVAATDMNQLFNDFDVQLPQSSPTSNAQLWDEIWREMARNGSRGS